MRIAEFAIHLGRAVCVLLLAYSAHGVVKADGGITCERLVGITVQGGGIIKDTGLCMPTDCTGTPYTCEEVVLVLSVPLTHGCNCGDTGKACTVAYVGEAGGQGGSAYCYSNSCSVPCPAPTITGQQFTSGGVTYNVITCSCPQ